MSAATEHSIERVGRVLGCYSEVLRRSVAGQLVKPRTNVDAEELLNRCLATLQNPPVIDRRVRDLSDASRKLLAVIGSCQRDRWEVGNLVQISASIGHAEGLIPIENLLKAGLLFPDLPDDFDVEINDFAEWIGSAGIATAPVFAPPTVSRRAVGEELGLPDLSTPWPDNSAPNLHKADGLDWLLRIAAAYQLAADGSVRLTNANALFKRDLGRLQSHEVLSAPFPDQLVPTPDVGVLSLYWAVASGLLVRAESNLKVGSFPDDWDTQLGQAQSGLWSSLVSVQHWDPLAGYRLAENQLPPMPTMAILASMLLAQGPADNWHSPAPLAAWLWEHHPSWSGTLPRSSAAKQGEDWLENFLLGVAYPLGMVEVARSTTQGWLVRLTDWGRHLLCGGSEPPNPPTYPQTLMVQPNAEIVAYRQGLTPGLIAKLSRFADWKGQGPACTLVLTAEGIYRGLESGLNLASITQSLNQHGMKPVPAPVTELLKRWAEKRERITLYASATLVEFQSAEDLDLAIARGLVAVKISDRIGVTDDGSDPDFRQLRLLGNRDYDGKQRHCLNVADDGLTLQVDTALADLLLEAELPKLAEPVVNDPPGLRRFRLTPTSVKKALTNGTSFSQFEEWFAQRTGQPLTPAAQLLAQAAQLPKVQADKLLVIRVGDQRTADGLMQWPQSKGLIVERIGPDALVLEEEGWLQLRELLASIGLQTEDR